MSRFSEAFITRVVVRGFRSLEYVDVTLTPLTVLVGPNASGKSSFLDALAFVQQALVESPANALAARGGLETLLTATGNRPLELSIKITLQSREPGAFAGTYALTLVARKKLSEFSLTEICEMQWGTASLQRFSVRDGKWEEAATAPPPPLAPERLALPLMAGLAAFAPMYTALASMTFYDMAWRMHASSRQIRLETAERLAPGGDNAVQVLKHLQDTPDLHADYSRLLQALAVVVPSIQQLKTRRTPDGRLFLLFEERFAGPPVEFTAVSMSDGTLYTLGLLLAAYQADMPTLMAFEEPENAIHPGAAAVIADVLQEAALRAQVLITTHSPDLLDHFDDTAVLRAVERTAKGVTVIAPIAESQRIAVREKLFTAGELHRIEGLRPAAASPER